MSRAATTSFSRRAQPTRSRADQLVSLDGVTHVAPLARTSGLFRSRGWTSDAMWTLTAFDQRFIAGRAAGPRGPRQLPTDREAWEAVLRDPTLAIVDPAFLQNGGGPANFAAEPGARSASRIPTPAARACSPSRRPSRSTTSSTTASSTGSPGPARSSATRSPSTALYVALRPGTDADRVRRRTCRRAFLANGTEAVSIPTIMDEGFTMTRQIFQLFQGYLAMGLIVGIAGTAVVMVRAVRERRRQIGTLRALGFGSRSVGRSFAIETGFVAAEGTVIGAALALVTLYDIVALSDSFGQMTSRSRTLHSLCCCSARWPHRCSQRSGRRSRRAVSGLRSPCG